MSAKITRRLFAICFAVCLVGCESKPTMVGVTGTVMLEGKPLGLGRILFEPASADDGTSAMGDIREDGSFELFTFKPGDGAVPGSYYPVVMDPKEDENAPRSRRIGVVQLTNTTFNVTEEGPNDFDVMLTKEDVSWAVKDD